MREVCSIRNEVFSLRGGSPVKMTAVGAEENSAGLVSKQGERVAVPAGRLRAALTEREMFPSLRRSNALRSVRGVRSVQYELRGGIRFQQSASPPLQQHAGKVSRSNRRRHEAAKWLLFIRSPVPERRPPTFPVGGYFHIMKIGGHK